MVLSVLLSLAVVGVQTRSRIKLGDFHAGLRCSGEVETKSVRGSSVTVTNMVSSSSYRLMRLHRLLSVDTAKKSVHRGQQAARLRARIKLCGGEKGGCRRRLRASSVRCARLMAEERCGCVGPWFRFNVLRRVRRDGVQPVSTPLMLANVVVVNVRTSGSSA